MSLATFNLNPEGKSPDAACLALVPKILHKLQYAGEKHPLHILFPGFFGYKFWLTAYKTGLIGKSGTCPAIRVGLVRQTQGRGQMLHRTE
jgi:hypothetical protein